MHLFIPNYPFVTLPPNFSNTSSQEHSLSYSQHFSSPMPLLRATLLVQLLLHMDFLGLYRQSSIHQHTSQCSPLPIPLIHSVYHTISFLQPSQKLQLLSFQPPPRPLLHSKVHSPFFSSRPHVSCHIHHWYTPSRSLNISNSFFILFTFPPLNT